MKNFFTKTKIYLLSVFVFTFVFLVACQPEANKLEKTCFDEIQNQGELYIDCGGPCDPCPARCNDCLKNGEETRPDCGGPTCPVCATCFDGIQNGHYINTSPNPGVDTIWTLVMESGIDCGYPCVQYCPSSCSNGIIDGNETGIDCGPGCNPCSNLFFSCTDGIRNGNEVGVDCDTIPGFCPDCGGTCNDGIMNQDEQGVDCGSYGCIVPCGVDFEPTYCPPATCWDGVMNGDETGIDCGGNCLNEAGDSVVLCPPGTQYDGIKNISNGTMEDGIDCGGDTYYFIGSSTDSTTIPCPTCTDLIKNGFETGIDCGGECINACPTCCDGVLNGEEMDVNGATGLDCIWGGAPNPYNHPCPACVNWVTATVFVVGLGATVEFKASGNNLVSAIRQGIGGSELIIKATDESGNKLEIKYTLFNDEPILYSGIHQPLNALIGINIDQSYIKFTPANISPLATWGSNTFLQTQGFLKYDPLITKFDDEKYFRGSGQAKCEILGQHPYGDEIQINNLQWGVTFLD